MADQNTGTWQEVFLRAVYTDASVSDAARRAGTDPRATAQARRQDPAFDRALERARTAALQRRIGPLLDALAEGTALAGAADQAGIALATLKPWRRQDSDLDARVLTAAARVGRTHPDAPRTSSGLPWASLRHRHRLRTTAAVRPPAPGSRPPASRRKEQRDEHNA